MGCKVQVDGRLRPFSRRTIFGDEVLIFAASSACRQARRRPCHQNGRPERAGVAFNGLRVLCSDAFLTGSVWQERVATSLSSWDVVLLR